VHKILIVDDDESMRNLLRMRLGDSYEVVDTGDPNQALDLALEHKPDAVVLELGTPKSVGLELCDRLRSLSYTSRIPIFVVGTKTTAEVGQDCEDLGATAYFEKPIDYVSLKRRMAEAVEAAWPERRAHARVRMRVVLKLRGTDSIGKLFEEVTATENVSAGGFLCNSTAALSHGTSVEVFLGSISDRYIGRARVVRKESAVLPWQRYAFQFEERSAEWVLQG